MTHQYYAYHLQWWAERSGDSMVNNWGIARRLWSPLYYLCRVWCLITGVPLISERLRYTASISGLAILQAMRRTCRHPWNSINKGYWAPQWLVNHTLLTWIFSSQNGLDCQKWKSLVSFSIPWSIHGSVGVATVISEAYVISLQCMYMEGSVSLLGLAEPLHCTWVEYILFRFQPHELWLWKK